ncbi:hypothetical protein RSJ42_09145 [Methanosarcina hadiensis]|uniref:hypothetical protein n=1 Tax=Methanosarcina hadiensis TaxID=3078083 RepID=UPI003977492E
MYQDNKEFKINIDESAKVWKYMDFTKFVSLLEKKALFFVKADKLLDPYEGYYSLANVNTDPSLVSRYELLQTFRGEVGVNCWHVNEHESAAMWKLYLKSDEGISIQSNFKKLKECFHCCQRIVYIGEINYVDYDTFEIPQDPYAFFMHKRRCFYHENEIRALISDVAEADTVSEKEVFDEIGAYIPVDLGILIENVFVSPTSPKWFLDLVRSISKKYELDKEIVKSSLFDKPMY